jgi:hypothetical protein
MMIYDDLPKIHFPWCFTSESGDVVISVILLGKIRPPWNQSYVQT